MKVLLLAVIIIAGVIIFGYAVFDNPHRFEPSECRSCHIDSERDPKSLTAPITELCRGCHKKFSGKSSHPVGIVPVTAKVPPDFVLQDGKLTCNTCHNIHGDRFTQFGEKTYFLRRQATGREFCLSCHTMMIPDSGHPAVLGVAHLSARFRVTDASQPLDQLSMECIGCHDGIAGKLTDFGAGIWRHETTSHPIGVDYQESRMKSGNLKPLSSISKKIRLFSGRIGCGTCHDAYSRLPNHLVMSNVGSSLCIRCHNL